MGEVPESGCCSCGWQNTYNEEERETFLAPGTLLNHGQYLIGRALGRGGFGITYLGRQQDGLGLKVAVKEYFPRKLAMRRMSRSPALLPLQSPETAQAKQAVLRERYEAGRAGFIEEAKRLAAFNELSAIVSVLGYFEENNTAYIVMEYVDGIDLQHYMLQMGRTLTVPEVKQLILPLAEDLDKVHKAGIIHRDISPDNIMVSRSGGVKLIDFGASVSRRDEEEVKVLRKNGFAPLEQYEASGDKLGPWTDIYALCATMYMLLSGKALQDARDRQTADTYQTLNALNIMVPGRLDRLLKKGLRQDWRERWPSMKVLAGQMKKVRCDKRLRGWAGAGAGLGFSLAACIAGIFFLYDVHPQVRQTDAEVYAASLLEMDGKPAAGSIWAGDGMINIGLGAFGTDGSKITEENAAASSATAYAVYDGLVYIRYVFEDGVIMLARSPVGTDDFQQVEYVTDGKFGQFCVWGDHLFFMGLEDHCIYRVSLSELMGLEDVERPIERLWEAGRLEKVSGSLGDVRYGFYIEEGYLYTMVEGPDSFELRRISVDGTRQYCTELALKLTNLLFREDYVFFTTKEGGESVLQRMRLDGCYHEELARYEGDIPAMVASGDRLYYLLNGAEESYLGSIGLNGAEADVLVRKNNQDLQYCSMTGIVDDNNIYYTCSVEGSEMLNNLYCFSLEEGNNRQISSECGRYIATSDEIPYIIFASMDGKEIRQMNKDGSNPRVMREADGGTGILETVDITSLAIIRDHVYYLDGENVAYKEIISEDI